MDGKMYYSEVWKLVFRPYSPSSQLEGWGCFPKGLPAIALAQARQAGDQKSTH